MRRWWRLKMDLLEKMKDHEHPMKGPVTLFDFTNFDDAADAKEPAPTSMHCWRYSDDSVIGGYSHATLNLIRSKLDLERVQEGERALNEEKDLDPDFYPFIRWKGTIDTTVGEDAPARVAKSGFCSIRSPTFPFKGAPLAGKYNALELTLRTDGRQYWCNIYPDSTLPDDLFQIALNAPPSAHATTDSDPTDEVQFQRVLLPINEFLNTAKGRLRGFPRQLEYGVDIKSIGFTLMDGLNGDFELDLASIRAINFFDGLILGEEDEDAPY